MRASRTTPASTRLVASPRRVASRRIALFLLVTLGAMALAGCGSSKKDERQPAVCREGSAVYLKALRAAPSQVLLAGETPISDCLVVAAEEGELADLGEATLAAATKLNAAARAQASGPAALRLGYLLGAIARGSADTEGVHAELLRRLTVAARLAPAGESLSPAFLAAYEKGFAAGRDHG